MAFIWNLDCALFFWPHSVAFRMLAPGPGTEPAPWAVKAQGPLDRQGVPGIQILVFLKVFFLETEV